MDRRLVIELGLAFGLLYFCLTSIPQITATPSKSSSIYNNLEENWDPFISNEPNTGNTRTPMSPGSIMDCLKDPRLSTLLKLVQLAGMSDFLASAFPMTLFAPTNSAFDLLPSSLLNHLMKNIEDLNYVLRGHVISNKVYKENLTDDTLISTFVSFNLLFVKFSYKQKMGIFLNEANITGPDWCLADTGFVHLIDRVIIHGNHSVGMTLAGLPKFSTLVSAMAATKVLSPLEMKQLTVLAPHNAAFKKLGDEVVDCLMTKNIPGLTKILQYHLVPGVCYSRVLGTFPSLQTYEGIHNITLSVVNNTVTVDNATVVHADTSASFGVIQTINQVLIPSSDYLGPCKTLI